MEGPFDAAEYRDEYRERVLALLERKASGAALPRAPTVTKPAASSLEVALRKSLAAIGRGATRPAAVRRAARRRRRSSHGSAD